MKIETYTLYLRAQGHSLQVREDGRLVLRTPKRSWEADNLRDVKELTDSSAGLVDAATARIFKGLVATARNVDADVRGR